MSIRSIYDSKVGDTIVINGRHYNIKGFIEFQEGLFKWKDFLVVDLNKQKQWLTVEADVNKRHVILSEKKAAFSIEETFTHKGVEFNQSEKGSASVINVEGVDDVEVEEVVSFIDFTSPADKETILSYEKWEWDNEEDSAGIEEEYFEGKLIPLENVKSYAPVEENKEAITLNHWRTLRQGDQVTIDKQIYIVEGYACYQISKEDKWLEFLIRDSKDFPIWLSIENGPDGELAYSLHKTIHFNGSTRSKNITYNNQKFRFSESGSGRVVQTRGNVDYDNNEPFSLYEYISEDNQILTIEVWEDEQESSVGKYIPSDSVSASFGNPKSISNAMSGKPGKSGGCLKCSFCIILSVAFSIFIGVKLFGSGETIRNKIEKDTNFKYLTTVTVEEPEAHKEFVYQSSLDMDATCKRIIQLDPENIDYVTVDTLHVDVKDDISQRFIRAKDATVLIYKSEDSLTYVQINENMPKESSRGHRYHGHYYRHLYRPYWHYRRSSDFYSNSMNNTNNVNTQQYSSYLNSARQESVRTRRSSGGGTRFGK